MGKGVGAIEPEQVPHAGHTRDSGSSGSCADADGELAGRALVGLEAQAFMAGQLPDHVFFELAHHEILSALISWTAQYGAFSDGQQLFSVL